MQITYHKVEVEFGWKLNLRHLMHKSRAQLAELNWFHSTVPCTVPGQLTFPCIHCFHRLKEVQSSDKSQTQSLQKQVKDLQTGTTSLQAERDKLAESLQEAEASLAELKDQVDTALGAEEMVEILTDNNLALEEEIMNLKETVQDLVRI